MSETLVTPHTDLTPFVGVRVKVTRTVQNTRYTYHGVWEILGHITPRASITGKPFCGGIMQIEPSPGMWSGNTGFDLPYDDATIELAPLES